MDDARYAEARQAYDLGDFRTAAKLFVAAAGDVPDGNGVAFHLAGNSLMRLRRYGDAVTMYDRALADEVYDKRGAVLVNRAQAEGALGEYAEAVASYEAALADPGYATAYKALQGMAGALLEMGRVEDAASAYRKAALDERNPNPGKALVNLGLCFMALGRPADAAEAYKAALGFDDYDGRGKALANLGQAQHAMGRNADAVKSFEKAVNLHAYPLSAAAVADYEASLAAITPRSREVVDGWATGEMPPVTEPKAPGGWETDELIELGPEPAAADLDAAGAVLVDFDTMGPGAGVVDDDAEVSAFLDRTDDDMKVRDREQRRFERAARREARNPWKIALVAVAVVVAIVVPLALLYSAGYGWPTQSGTASALLDAHGAGEAVDVYWVAVPERDVAKEMAKIPPFKAYTIDDVERGSTASTVTVTVTPEKGAPLHYGIGMQREGAGWRVIGIENDWDAGGP